MIAAMQMFDYDTSLPDNFSDDLCVHRELNEFREKVDVRFCAELDDTETVVEIQLNSGGIYKKVYDLEKENLRNKVETTVRKKAQTLVGQSVEQQIWEMIQDKNISSSVFMQFLAACS